MWIRNLLCLFLTISSSNFSVAQKTEIDGNNYTARKEVKCTNGAVASAHPLATKAGVLVMKKGGNAFDAAIATQLMLAVVYPRAGNIGGGGFLVAYRKNGNAFSLDYRETAPVAATRDMYLDANGNAQLNLSQAGHLSAGVPGTVAGLFETMKYARLAFRQLIEPAIQIAANGFALTKREADSLNTAKQKFLKNSTRPSAFARETEWKEGDLFVQKELAETLRRIRDNGAAGFYKGKTADLIVEEMKRGNGIITHKDLQNYRVKKRAPFRFNYRGHEVITMPLPSSGGIIVQQMLIMVSDRNLKSMKFHSPEAVQLMIEAERRAFADRAEYLGDPDFVKVPVKQLTSKAYLKQRMADFKPGVAGRSDQVKRGVVSERLETTHVSIVDKEGNAVSVTTTLNDNFGSKTIVGGAGFLLNDEMDDFSIKPGVANMYGAIGNEKNAIAPGKRMLSSMTPTIVVKNKKPYLVVGTPGGTTIPTSVFQSIVNVVDFNLTVSESVNKPKFHHQWLPDVVYVEPTFPAATKAALENMGYKFTDKTSIGRTEAILINYGKNNKKNITAVADSRGDDSAEGY
jgi:gamma-glutamyltranspeptidase / glutathione hydrolase